MVFMMVSDGFHDGFLQLQGANAGDPLSFAARTWPVAHRGHAHRGHGQPGPPGVSKGHVDPTGWGPQDSVQLPKKWLNGRYHMI